MKTLMGLDLLARILLRVDRLLAKSLYLHILTMLNIILEQADSLFHELTLTYQLPIKSRNRPPTV